MDSTIDFNSLATLYAADPDTFCRAGPKGYTNHLAFQTGCPAISRPSNPDYPAHTPIRYDQRKGTTVLIVDDVPEFQQRFAAAVQADARLHLLGVAGSGTEALACLEQQAPDVMLIDLGLPDMNGVEVIRHAARHHPGTESLVVTMFGDDGNVLSSIKAGATGYLLKDSLPESIAACIHELRAGGSPISPSIARRVLTRYRGGSPTSNAAPVAATAGVEPPLTERETDILRQVAKGMSFAEIGNILTISQHTVVTHVKKIYRKLAVHSRDEAVFEANQMGLL